MTNLKNEPQIGPDVWIFKLIWLYLQILSNLWLMIKFHLYKF